ncbi:hypothetical protein PROFUN_06864 [Planoprotostelium fungivorum]|uniref:SPX domain-containing protein n=1 Tax=Planoprotostelium fungivorum TaxID=1890364 RepID=A0A2P6NNG2_9EUKA|nr:hypothetical protein PROFUN_06864 [Planoprotostelium fungivorum]
MKFGKELNATLCSLPSEWHSYTIQYKQLKKLITQLVLEMRDVGLSPEELREGKISKRIVFENQGQNVISTVCIAPNESEGVDSEKLLQMRTDSAFFSALFDTLSGLSNLEKDNRKALTDTLEVLSDRLLKAASPREKDMYIWRNIFGLYHEASVFNITSDKNSRDRLDWFNGQMRERKFRDKLHHNSRDIFDEFILILTQLVSVVQFQRLNQKAMRKILKKHDKRTGLGESTYFSKFIAREELSLSADPCTTASQMIALRVTRVVPQPEDYSCPVCMDIAWKPIRLSCSHLFCLPCLIKAQDQEKWDCPVCRCADSVKKANGGNIDRGVQKLMQLYFPKEIQKKAIERSKELAIRDYEALTGYAVSNDKCVLM